MIVDGMKEAQIVQEIERARQRCDTWYGHNAKSIRRHLMQSKTGFYVVRLPVGSPKTNCILITQNDRSNKRMPFNFLIWKETAHGKHFYSTTYTDQCINYEEYTAHFVARLIERKYTGCTPMEAMIQYIKGLSMYGYWYRETVNAPTAKLTFKIAGSMQYRKTIDGISVTDRTNNFYIHKTFMTDDMGFRCEKPLFQELIQNFQHWVENPSVRHAQQSGYVDVDWINAEEYF